jgi:hypothetical protein
VKRMAWFIAFEQEGISSWSWILRTRFQIWGNDICLSRIKAWSQVWNGETSVYHRISVISVYLCIYILYLWHRGFVTLQNLRLISTLKRFLGPSITSGFVVWPDLQPNKSQ